MLWRFPKGPHDLQYCVVGYVLREYLRRGRCPMSHMRKNDDDQAVFQEKEEMIGYLKC